MTVEVGRYWINQPSTLQSLHHLHAENVLAHHEYDDTYRVYFLHGKVHSMQVLKSQLSEGWIAHGNPQCAHAVTCVCCRDRYVLIAPAGVGA